MCLRCSLVRVKRMEKNNERMSDRRIGKPIVAAQKTLLLEYLKQHENLQTGRFTKDFTFKIAQKLWEEITNVLNSVPNGAQKDWKQWRKTWQDLKKNTKAKAATIKKSFKVTGGGDAEPELSPEDTEILELISPAAVEGLEGINECGINVVGAEVMVDENIDPEETDVAVPSQDTRNEHLYSRAGGSTPSSGSSYKRVNNKTLRVQNAMKVSQGLLQSLNTKNDMQNAYYEEKIRYMKQDMAYRKRKLELQEEANNTMREAVNVLVSIKNIMTEYFTL